MSRAMLIECTYSVRPRTGTSTGIGDDFEDRLRAVSLRAIARFARRDLIVHLNLIVDGLCPLEHRDVVLLAAAEMVANAVEHGFRRKQNGKISLWLSRGDAPDTHLDVSDDGRGFDIDSMIEGRGVRLLRSLGKVSFHTYAEKTEWRTTVSLIIPPCGSAAGVGAAAAYGGLR